MKLINHVSLFSGAGGIDLGFKWAGIKTIFASDIKEFACETLRANCPETFIYGPPFFDGDIRKLNSEIIYKTTGIKEIDVLSGGPPCQSFSIAANQRYTKDDIRFKRKGDKDPEKGDLLYEYIRLINDIKPKVFIIENVSQMINWDGGDFLKNSLKLIDKEYNISKPAVINCEAFGVPQYRKRMIIIGVRSRYKTPCFDDSIIEIDRVSTVDDALQNFSDNLANHTLRKHTSESIARYSKLHYGERDHLGRVDKLDPNLPSKTVIAGGEHGGGRSHLHPYYPRTTSPRECARFQTFADDYVFKGSMSRQFTQIGNAVPPLLAYFIAVYIKKFVFNIDSDIYGDLSAVEHPVVQSIPGRINHFDYDHQEIRLF